MCLIWHNAKDPAKCYKMKLFIIIENNWMITIKSVTKWKEVFGKDGFKLF